MVDFHPTKCCISRAMWKLRNHLDGENYWDKELAASFDAGVVLTI